MDVEIPSSTDTLKQKFTDPPVEPGAGPDQAGPEGPLPDGQPAGRHAGERRDPGRATCNGRRRPRCRGRRKRLAFRFGDDESLKLIPECFKPDVKTARNRGAVEDYWDKGVTLPSFLTSWYSDKPQRLGALLLVCVGLLSVEWLMRKLLKLA